MSRQPTRDTWAGIELGAGYAWAGIELGGMVCMRWDRIGGGHAWGGIE